MGKMSCCQRAKAIRYVQLEALVGRMSCFDWVYKYARTQQRHDSRIRIICTR